MKTINHRQSYDHKLQKIKILELTSYQELEKVQESYKAKVDFYRAAKDQIGTKIRMLEVYQNLWEDVEAQMSDQSFLGEEFWHNITFNILKYNKFIQELDHHDYTKKAKTAMDKKVSKALWDEREQAFTSMKNDINQMYTGFNKMHSEIHKRALAQRACLDKHICFMEEKYAEAALDIERYRSVFHEIRQDIGAKGNKFSRQALENYKQAILQKIEVSQDLELDMAW